jgi:hypothetical protein
VTTGTCHDHSGKKIQVEKKYFLFFKLRIILVVPQSWPTKKEILNYKKQVRERILSKLEDVLKTVNTMTIKGRAVKMVSEHDYMVTNMKRYH